MRKDDARKLDHATLETLCARRVQEGESPEVVAWIFGVEGPRYRDVWRNTGVVVGAP